MANQGYANDKKKKLKAKVKDMHAKKQTFWSKATGGRMK